MNRPHPRSNPVDLHELTLADQTRMVAGLRAALQADQPRLPVELIETHISFVLVGVEFAWKLKKALNPGFLDFTTLARRQLGCEDEVRLNRRLAPDLYLDVVLVTGSVAAPSFGGEGVAIDVAVRMRAFDQDGLWDRMATRGELRAAHIDDLAAQLCTFHRDAAVADEQDGRGRPAQVRAPMLDNLAVLDLACTSAADRSVLADIRRWEAATFASLAGVFAQRLRDGRVREGHGDLHLGNVACIDGRTTVFDCIEFNATFRWIDVMSEIAFLAMDLHGHGLPALAHRFVNAYLECTGDYAGVRVLRYYVVHRALVRAKVGALRAAQMTSAKPGAPDPVRHFLALAAAMTRPQAPRVTITHGFSGSGKTTGSQAIVESTGAIRIRADVERKRLFGLEATARSGSALNAALYDPSATALTYERLCELAGPVLDGGHAVVLDATFLQREQRDRARRLATGHGVPFLILEFDVDTDTLRDRVSQRLTHGGDASEADLDVLAAQLRTAQPLGADERTVVVEGRSVPRSTDG